MIEALKEFNINDMKDLFMAGGLAQTEQFEKGKRAPPPHYYLESSHGDAKDCLTSYQLEPYFGGRHLKDFDLLFKLDTGVSAIDFDQNIPTIRNYICIIIIRAKIWDSTSKTGTL